MEVTTDWPGSSAMTLQVEGNDLVSVTDIDWETGGAWIKVYESTHPDAAIIFEGRVNLAAHLDAEDEEED
ncbi:hypothetical protein ACFVAJ_17145 [Agromyces sp. NPDC057679]|uniref:hypothetical protein n=1 Tax=Agromyces sp. NPDC057679 TaxID=3346207 RepID=UPI0036708565